MVATFLALGVGVLIGCLVGYFGRDTRDQIQELRDAIDGYKHRNDPAEPKSAIWEPKTETPVERAKREQAELIESLNVPR